MSVFPSLNIYSVTTAFINSNKLSIPVQIDDTRVRNVETLALINSGTGGMFIDQNFAKTNGFELHKLETPMHAYNVDRTENKQGTIKTYINLDLKINGRRITTKLLVTGLGKEQLILRSPG